MRLLHTADWHLGRTLGGHSLHEEQEELLLRQLPALVRDTRADAVLVAGDVFDRAVPPAEAVRLLDEILSRIVLGLNTPVVLIPGNHDESRRVAFGARLLQAARLHIIDAPCGEAVTLRDEHGPVTILGLGYATPLALSRAAAMEGCDFDDHDSAFAILAPRLHAMCAQDCRRVLVMHGFVAGGSECRESERALSVGGTGQIGADRFAGFHYVALGHLHRPQSLLGGRLRYSGSPFPYSIEEADHAKSVTLAELDARGAVRIEEIALAHRRRLREVVGRFDDLRDHPPEGHEDFVSVVLTDPAPVPEAQRRLAEVFPRIVALRYGAPRAAIAGPVTAAAEARAARPLDLFGRFHAAVRGTPLPEEARPVLIAAVEAAESAGR